VAAVAVLGACAGLAGCSPDTYDGGDGAACPQLPLDVVTEVADGLAADPKGPGGSPPESGKLPASPSATGVVYRCRWSGAEDDDGSWALSVTVETSSADDLAVTRRSVERWSGRALSGSAPGSGKSFLENGVARAAWICDFRKLDVQIADPAEGSDGAARLAEALIPKIGCTGP
jgi:hypothetical protein